MLPDTQTSLPDDLVTAIGRVAINSARCEDLLRLHVSILYGRDDYNWMLFEGQNMDWLLGTLQARLAAVGGISDERRTHLGGLRIRIKRYQDVRNWIIHGTFEPMSPFLEAQMEDCGSYDLPWKHIEGGETWACTRSRHMRGRSVNYGRVMVCSIADINKLAAEFDNCTRAL